MIITMLTWEYPPYKVGGIASHCYDLARFLLNTGNEVHVITCGENYSEEIDNGVFIHRVPGLKALDTVTWATSIAHRIEKVVINIKKNYGLDIVHAHDWMMVPTAVGIKKLLSIPFVFTIHSTEQGRSGVHNLYTKFINDLEWLGCYEANYVITVGKEFYSEVKNIFSVPEEKICYIPNGIDIKRIDNCNICVSRSEFVADWEKMCLFVGRHTYQKGIEYLLLAAKRLLYEHTNLKFVFVGSGNIDYYRYIASTLNIYNKVYFTGYLPDKIVISLFKLADIVMIPSIYEPFGIVALEAGATSKTSIASYVGGLKEIIVHEVTGLHTIPANPVSIVNQTNEVLNDEVWMQKMGRNARKRIESLYTWEKIVRWTIGVYSKAMGI